MRVVLSALVFVLLAIGGAILQWWWFIHVIFVDVVPYLTWMIDLHLFKHAKSVQYAAQC